MLIRNWLTRAATTILSSGSDEFVQFTATDGVFGIGNDPELYSAFARGFESGGSEFVCVTRTRAWSAVATGASPRACWRSR